MALVPPRGGWLDGRKDLTLRGTLPSGHGEQTPSTLVLQNCSPGSLILNKKEFRVKFNKYVIITHKIIGIKEALVGTRSMEDIVQVQGTRRSR